MAKKKLLFYGVQGDGMGHALRSKPIIAHLIKKGYKIKIFSSGKARKYLAQFFDDTVEIKTVGWEYVKHSVSYTRTISKQLTELPEVLMHAIVPLVKAINKDKPDLVISDFEPSIMYASIANQTPFLCIDNIQMVRLGKYSIKKRDYLTHITAKTAIRMLIPMAKFVIITNFFKTPLRKKNAMVIDPIIRDEITKKKPTQKEHIIVYQTTFEGKEELLQTLGSCKKYRFKVYGVKAKSQWKNVIIREFSNTQFINDLASAKAVITNGGHTLISEALYLKKPIFTSPLKGQFEQILNAEMVQKLGYGVRYAKITKEHITEFVKKLPTYQKNVNKYEHTPNEELYTIIEKKVKDILREKKNSLPFSN